jgi:hypothetical protein
MKLILFMILFLAAAVQSSNCEKNSSVNKELTLKYGQTIDIKEEKLKIKFVSVDEDSRCPQGEQCIRAGNAGITIEITKTGTNPVSIALSTSGESQEFIYQNLGIKLVDLKPYPKSGVDSKHTDYVAILRITKQTESP